MVLCAGAKALKHSVGRSVKWLRGFWPFEFTLHLVSLGEKHAMHATPDKPAADTLTQSVTATTAVPLQWLHFDSHAQSATVLLEASLLPQCSAPQQHPPWRATQHWSVSRRAARSMVRMRRLMDKEHMITSMVYDGLLMQCVHMCR